MSEKALLSLKIVSQNPEGLAPGHRLCAGCAESIVARQVMLAAGPDPCVIGCATGCLEVATTIYPFSAWKVPWIHSAFGNVGATMSGVEAAYKSLQRQGRISAQHRNFIAFAGDGGTYDIGLQALSGAWERGHRFLTVCFNNEGYMNTGIQRSSATPMGASTTTSPSGESISGKLQWRKDLIRIANAHRIPYIAQTLPFNMRMMDLAQRVRKALDSKGPSFINVLSPCSRGWRFEPQNLFKVAEMAVETCYWPLFEIVDGKWHLNYQPIQKRPIEDFLRLQDRFKHLFAPGGEIIRAAIQNKVDMEWETILKECELK
mgnify:CR=1 FL=1